MKKNETIEVTRVITCQITMVEQVSPKFEVCSKEAAELALKDVLDCDDVKVISIKNFVK